MFASIFTFVLDCIVVTSTIILVLILSIAIVGILKSYAEWIENRGNRIVEALERLAPPSMSSPADEPDEEPDGAKSNKRPASTPFHDLRDQELAELARLRAKYEGEGRGIDEREKD